MMTAHHAGVTYVGVDTAYFEKRSLSRFAGVWSLWALGVGGVISGHFSGWNFGLATGGFGGMLVAAAIMASIRRAVEDGCKPLAAIDVAALCVPIKRASSHILDHALTQWADGDSVGHGEFQSLSEVAKTSILKLELPASQLLLVQLVTAHSGSAPASAGWSAAI